IGCGDGAALWPHQAACRRQGLSQAHQARHEAQRCASQDDGGSGDLRGDGGWGPAPLRSREQAAARATLLLVLTMEMSWRLWQLADSAFPTGGFAHSAGLEAALQLGEIPDSPAFERFLRDALWQAGQGALPWVSGAHDDPERL